MSKTAMQELVEKWDRPESVEWFIDWFVENKKRLLEDDREQIIEAYQKGCADFMNNKEIPGEDYYNSLTTKTINHE